MTSKIDLKSSRHVRSYICETSMELGSHESFGLLGNCHVVYHQTPVKSKPKAILHFQATKSHTGALSMFISYHQKIRSFVLRCYRPLMRNHRAK